MSSISEELKKEIVDRILEFCKPSKVIVFGSFARGDVSVSSDIDLALFGIDSKSAFLLKEILNNKLRTLKDIDVVNFDDLDNDDLKNRILQEGVVIYEQS